MSERRHSQSTDKFALLIFILAVVVSFYVHSLAGYTLPAPWPDEAHFLWQSTAFAEHGTLFAPELNSYRDILWQPPGYFVLTGAVFEVFGADLWVARFASLIFLLCGLAVFWLILRRFVLPWPVYLLSGLFWTGSNFVACGNVARMEAPLIAFGLLGIYFLLRNRSITGLAILAITPLIHPNGLFFIAGGILILLLNRDDSTGSRLSPNRFGILACVLALGLWLWYAVYVAGHWDSFVHDMQFQFARKGQRSWVSELYSQDSVRFIVYFLPGLIWSIVGKRQFRPLPALAFSLWLLWVAGGEMWYRVFYLLAVLIAQILLIALACSAADNLKLLDGKWRRYLLAAVVGVFLLLTNLRFHNIERVWNLNQSLSFCDMTPQLNFPYNEPVDISIVSDKVRKLAIGGTTTIELVPSADAFLFTQLRDDGYQFSIPLFCKRTPDILIYHDSPTLPAKFRVLWQEGLTTRGIDTITSPEFLIHENATGEKWYVRWLR